MTEPVVVLWDLYQALSNDRFYQTRVPGEPQGIIPVIMARMGKKLKVNQHTIKCINYLCYSVSGFDCLAAVAMLVQGYEYACGGGDINERYSDINVPYECNLIELRNNLEIMFKEIIVSSNIVKKLFREMGLPLPFELYKNDPDNSVCVLNALIPPEKERHGSGIAFDIDKEVAKIVVELRRGTKQKPAEINIAPENAIASPAKTKTPDELLALHKGDPKTWTTQRLGDKFFPRDPKAKPSTKRGWACEQLNIARGLPPRGKK